MSEIEVNINIPIAFKPLFEKGRYRYKIFHGGRGSAKSWSFARALLIIGRSRKVRILCTREIQNSIKDSVHKLLKDIITENGLIDYEVKNDSITNAATGTEFIFRGIKHNTQEIKSMEGIDYCWVEEAQSVSMYSLKILIPTIRKLGSEVWFSFNRFIEMDPVYERFCINPDEKTFVRQVSWRDNPYFNQTLREEKDRDEARDKDEYLHIWEGEPLYQSEDSLLTREEILNAMTRTVPDDGAIEIGVDVARYGKDKTVLFKRKGLASKDYQKHGKLGVNMVVEKTKMFCAEGMEGEDDKGKGNKTKVDATGVGGGVSDYLRADGYNAIDVNFGASPKDKDKYNMLISEAWFEFKDMIKEVSLPDNKTLFNELVNRKWRIDKKGKRCIESKDDYKKRGFKSPDFADACILCFYNYDGTDTFEFVKIGAEGEIKNIVPEKVSAIGEMFTELRRK